MNSRPIMFAFLSLSLALVALAGCNPPPPKLVGGGMDMFTPVKMRLHPLSRVMPESAEARIEFTDQFGDTCKGVGDISLQLYSFQPLTLDHKGTLLDHWSTDIATPQQNQAAWDAITRTYLFKHALAPTTLGKHDQVLLAATVTLPNGQKLSDTITLPAK